MKAMILAAGLGTRLKPLTNDIPKALVKINDVPLLGIIINRLKYFGFDDIIINVHHFADKVIDFLKSQNNFGIDITISDERNLLLDTGGGIKKASWFFNDEAPFLVHNVDIISKVNLKELYEHNKNTGSSITLTVNKRKSDRYLLFNQERYLCAWENINTKQRKTVSSKIEEYRWRELDRFGYCGIKVMHPKVFEYFPTEDIFSIIDFYLKVASKEKVNCFFNENVFWQDVGTIEQLRETEKFLKNNNLLN